MQKVTNSNTLDVLREQSNVGERVFFSSLWEALISKNWRGDLEREAGLATEWRRVDDQIVELKLRQGVKFHNGDEMTAEDVIFSFSRERMFGRYRSQEPQHHQGVRADPDAAPRQGTAARKCRLPRAVRGPTSSASRPWTNTRCASSTPRPM